MQTNQNPLETKGLQVIPKDKDFFFFPQTDRSRFLRQVTQSDKGGNGEVKKSIQILGPEVRKLPPSPTPPSAPLPRLLHLGYS